MKHWFCLRALRNAPLQATLHALVTFSPIAKLTSICLNRNNNPWFTCKSSLLNLITLIHAHWHPPPCAQQFGMSQHPCMELYEVLPIHSPKSHTLSPGLSPQTGWVTALWFLWSWTQGPWDPSLPFLITGSPSPLPLLPQSTSWGVHHIGLASIIDRPCYKIPVQTSPYACCIWLICCLILLSFADGLDHVAQKKCNALASDGQTESWQWWSKVAIVHFHHFLPVSLAIVAVKRSFPVVVVIDTCILCYHCECHLHYHDLHHLFPLLFALNPVCIGLHGATLAPCCRKISSMYFPP